MKWRSIGAVLFCWMAIHGQRNGSAGAETVTGNSTLSLDQAGWKLLIDPKNSGIAGHWFANPPAQGAKDAPVPGVIQQPFPGYHGVAWYFCSFHAPANPNPAGRTLLRFWAVDYLARVWVNGLEVGAHEGGETPFVLDVTAALKAGQPNLLAVRVLNPDNEPIDGIRLSETAHRNKVVPYGPGSAFDTGGIMDSVELLLTPVVRIADLWVRPDLMTGVVKTRISLHSDAAQPTRGAIEVAISAAPRGEAMVAKTIEMDIPPGDSQAEVHVTVADVHPWNVESPSLYQSTVRLHAGDAVDQAGTRFGFRDFRFEDGYFRLNGRRIFLRCSHTGNCTPVSMVQVAVVPDQLRRDLIYCKAMGFNAVRFIAGMPTRYQLELCDELGLMVYEESLAGWMMQDSPRLPERYDASIREMILRDRNHPCVTIWGLLNETNDGPVFRHAAAALPAVRSVDDTRMVFLNTGRFDRQYPEAPRPQAPRSWHGPEVDPCVTFNVTDAPISLLGITWAPRQLALHPGPRGEYSVARFTAAGDDQAAAVECLFKGIAEHATTDVHVLHNQAPLFDSGINIEGQGNQARWKGTVSLAAGDTLDFVVGFGNGNYGGDTTALLASITSSSGRKLADAATDFSGEKNPNGRWSYGMLKPGSRPDPSSFTLYSSNGVSRGFGSFANPESNDWQDGIQDVHDYPRVPHTADILRHLRSLDGGSRAVFLSEYGIGSAVDLVNIVKHYDQGGWQGAEDAGYYRSWRDQFLADWRQWKMADTFITPEAYFHDCLAKMASQRAVGLDAIRSNPHIVGHSLTGTVDQGMTGEGLFTTFREPKPGTFDAVTSSFAPLHWCIFPEPLNLYCGQKVHIDVVLANEDALLPGEHHGHVVIAAPNRTVALDRPIVVTIPKPDQKPPASFALPVLSEDLTVQGPAGEYRILASLDDAAPTGGEAVFHADQAAEMPQVSAEVTLWGDDARLAGWLSDHHIRTRPYAAADWSRREVLLIGAAPAAGGATAFADLARHIAVGSTAIFLTPTVFAQDASRPLGYLPLKNKGSLNSIVGWLYLKDEWNRRHPIFAGLPSGGLMDYSFYRELIPDAVLSGQDRPELAIAGANQASLGYQSGLMLAEYKLGEGRFLLNTLLIRENLGAHPAAERILRNLLNDAARDAANPAAPLPTDFDEQLKAVGLARSN